MSNNVKSSRTMWDPIMLTCLHPSNQGPDVGKFKSEFPSDFHHCLHYSYSSVYHLNFPQNVE